RPAPAPAGAAASTDRVTAALAADCGSHRRPPRDRDRSGQHRLFRLARAADLRGLAGSSRTVRGSAGQPVAGVARVLVVDRRAVRTWTLVDGSTRQARLYPAGDNPADVRGTALRPRASAL